MYSKKSKYDTYFFIIFVIVQNYLPSGLQMLHNSEKNLHNSHIFYFPLHQADVPPLCLYLFRLCLNHLNLQDFQKSGRFPQPKKRAWTKIQAPKIFTPCYSPFFQGVGVFSFFIPVGLRLRLAEVLPLSHIS